MKREEIEEKLGVPGVKSFNELTDVCNDRLQLRKFIDSAYKCYKNKYIIGFFYDVEYSFVGRGAENKKINDFLRKVSREIQYRKNNRKGRRD